MNKAKQETVLVGMSGRVDSAVAAYLLKKQGFNVIGISLVFFDGGDSCTQSGLHCADCHNRDLDRTKKICDNLGIPFYASNGKEMFQEKIFEGILTARLSGKNYSPCIYCNLIKIQILISKMEKFDAQYVSTGHYAKIKYSHSLHEYAIYNPAERDMNQTFELAALTQQEMSKLLLPLGELRRTDVFRIAKTLGIDLHYTDRKKEMCLVHDPKLDSLIEEKVAESLRPTGSIYSIIDETNMGEHHGIHKFYLGKNRLKSESSTSTIDATWEVHRIDPRSGHVYIGPRDYLSFDQCLLANITYLPSLDISHPMIGYAKWGFENRYGECEIFFKSNNRLMVKFKEKRSEFRIGDSLILYDKKDDMERVIIIGEVWEIDDFESYGDVFKLETEEEVEEQGEEENKSTLIGLDMSF